jgi:hypothetical protein
MTGGWDGENDFSVEIGMLISEEERKPHPVSTERSRRERKANVNVSSFAYLVISDRWIAERPCKKEHQ